MASVFVKDNYFKIDTECHIVGDEESIHHYPGVQMWWKSIQGVTRPLVLSGLPDRIMQEIEPHEMTKRGTVDALIEDMDKYGVDIACLLPESMMETTNYSQRWSTNADAQKWCETHPDRFLVQPNLSPIKFRGVKNCIIELVYWVKEKGAKIFKYYPPEDTYMNDPELWPFYEKAQELGIVLDMHTGASWVPPGKTKYCHPDQLDDVARDFPELKINAFHMGYPYCDQLNLIAATHPNVYISTSLLTPWGVTAPRTFAKMIGEALRFAGPDKITWGTDYVGMGVQYKLSVEGIRGLEIPEDMQKGHGYPALTDEIKGKIFGGNLARLLGIDTTKRRVPA